MSLMMNLSQAVQMQLQSAFSTGVIPDWFHGIIQRKTAEELLMSKPQGYFLIRVSESRVGYTLSYRAEVRCRHFMIDVTEDGHYIIVGEKKHHQLLQDLVDFHRHTPIAPYNEVLTIACGKKDDSINYAELLFPQRHLRNDTNSQLRSSPLPPQEVPPALPYRSNIPRNLEVQDPMSREPHVTSSYPDIPVPKPRNRYKVDDLQSSTSPELPARNFVPQPKQNISLAPSPSIPPPTGDLVCTNADNVKNLAAKSSVVSNLKFLNKIFPTKKFPNTEKEYEAMKEVQTLNGPHVLCTDAELPQEYLPPPPFAPGY